MPTLLDDHRLESLRPEPLDRTYVPALDLERLAGLPPAAPDLAPPRFVALEPACSRRILTLGLLAALLVAALATLRPDIDGAYTTTPLHASGPASPAAVTAGDVCPLAD